MDAIILGAGGTGQELAHRLRLRYYNVKFLDDVKQSSEILGTIADYHKFTDKYQLFAAIGSYHSMAQRKRILKNMPQEFFGTFIDSGACIYETKKIPRGSVIFFGAVVTHNVVLGNHIFIYHNATISHDCNIGGYSIISNGAIISGNVMVGESCYIGTGSVVKENCKIGANAIIAAGAVVHKDVPENSIYINKNDIRPNKYFRE